MLIEEFEGLEGIGDAFGRSKELGTGEIVFGEAGKDGGASGKGEGAKEISQSEKGFGGIEHISIEFRSGMA